MKKLFFVVTAASLLCVATPDSAQNLKIGFVDSQEIFKGLPEAQKAQKDLDARLKLWNDSLDTMTGTFQKEFETYQAQQGTMSEAANKAKLAELQKMQNDIQEYRTKKFGQNGEGVELRTKVLQPLQEKVLKAIEEIAKEEKIHFMFDKIADASALLYADPKFDYTYKVLDRLKRGSN